jgi:hypothetical protein
VDIARFVDFVVSDAYDEGGWQSRLRCVERVLSSVHTLSKVVNDRVGCGLSAANRYCGGLSCTFNVTTDATKGPFPGLPRSQTRVTGVRQSLQRRR